MHNTKLTKDDIITISQYIDQYSDQWYNQLRYIDGERKPLVFYSTEEQYDGTMDQGWPVPVYKTIPEVRKQMLRDYSRWYEKNDLAAKKILSASLSILKDADQHISSLSSFFILLEGHFHYTDLETQVLYNHYHPARGSKTKCMVSSYLMLNNKFTETTEQFGYADFNQINVDPPKFYDMDDATRAATLNHYCNLPDLDWQKFDLPKVEGDILRIDFNAHRYAHNVTPLTENIWLMFVFNDVNFRDHMLLTDKEIRFNPHAI